MSNAAALDSQFSAIAASAEKGASKAKLREASEEFEAVFLAQILNSMSQGISADGPFSGGPAEDTYRSMLNEQYANTISRQGGVGIADQVYREMIKLQEVGAGKEQP